MYKKVSTNLNFVEREKETAQFWKDHDIFKKSIETREGDPVYTLSMMHHQQPMVNLISDTF